MHRARPRCTTPAQPQFTTSVLTTFPVARPGSSFVRDSKAYSFPSDSSFSPGRRDPECAGLRRPNEDGPGQRKGNLRRHGAPHGHPARQPFADPPRRPSSPPPPFCCKPLSCATCPTHNPTHAKRRLLYPGEADMPHLLSNDALLCATAPTLGAVAASLALRQAPPLGQRCTRAGFCG